MFYLPQPYANGLDRAVKEFKEGVSPFNSVFKFKHIYTLQDLPQI